MKKWIVLAVLVIAAVAGGVMFYRSKPAEASNELITAQVTRGNVIETVQSTGTLEAVTTVQVGTQVSGIIKALHADLTPRCIKDKSSRSSSRRCSKRRWNRRKRP